MKKIKKIELSFACDEDWNKMTPVERGRHCSSCQKSVIDFSAFTDRQIIAFYEESNNASTCGRFRVGQLEKLNENINAPIPKRHTNFLRPILATALLTAACSSEMEQGEINVEPLKDNSEQLRDTVFRMGKVAQSEKNKAKKHIQSTNVGVSPIEKDTIKIKEQVLIETNVVHTYPTVTKINETYHTAGIPVIDYDERINELHTVGIVVNKNYPWYKRVGYRIRYLFRRTR